MNRAFSNLCRDYGVILRRYLADEQEATLEQAYALGRGAIAQGFGVLDMARAHQHALENQLRGILDPELQRRALRNAGVFLLETLSPFEMTHRGFGETNVKLQQLIQTLERQNLELASINRELEREISERKRTEQALRESERHFRALFHQARQMEENLRHLSNQILHAQEEERKRISRELHDQVGQALTAVSVTLATLKSGDSDDTAMNTSISPKLTDAQRLLRETMEIVHSFARELRPTILDELGLVPALRSYLKAFAGRTGLRVQFHGNAFAEKLAIERKTVLFRIAQESLTNVAKHARASQVEVTLRKVKGGIAMEVVDNGKSFRASLLQQAGRKRLGLLGMQERVRLVDGQFTVKAEPGCGTTIKVVIPVNSTAGRMSQRPDRIGLPARSKITEMHRSAPGDLLEKKMKSKH